MKSEDEGERREDKDMRRSEPGFTELSQVGVKGRKEKQGEKRENSLMDDQRYMSLHVESETPEALGGQQHQDGEIRAGGSRPRGKK